MTADPYLINKLFTWIGCWVCVASGIGLAFGMSLRAAERALKLFGLSTVIVQGYGAHLREKKAQRNDR